ncbi:LuxR family transcriptional regulator [Actinoplanes sp. NBRC 103695]|uniref:LuxR C-terminal-related transcriptional regulator n=1 Tax=Actinoplanes sp. NBRC 103695 TaxID=3032202 RepID=UPI0024A4CAFA|nr:LuxR family transcriptional regulator [Actinoplanes sp. NBRC 103695]GLY97399.1 LuxR family transcriptional regulator [Actinoplanes sp. NBRC 103695]
MGNWDFVGRTGELDRFIRAADNASSTETRGLILSGDPGIGKSRLLCEATRTLPADQYAVFSASATIGATGLPFGSLAQVLPPDPPAGLSAPGLLRWAAGALRSDGGARRLVLAVDDVHLLDRTSAALIHLLVREGATLLGTRRTGEPAPAPIAALWTEGLVVNADLLPLSTEESRELLTSMLGGPLETTSARQLSRFAGGNPLLLRELVMAARQGGEISRSYGMWRWTGKLTLAPSLADLVDARIGGLTPGVRDVLELVAFGEPIGLHLVLQGCVPADAEAAEERGLIRVTEDGRRRDVRLAHPLYGEVVRQHCPATRSRRLHATLADLVGSTGARRRDDLLRVAVWRLDSGTAQDGGMLLDAAVQAFGRFDLGLAQRLAGAAWTHGAGYDAAELLSTVLLFADRPDEALAALDRADGPPARRLIARATVAFWGQGRADTADELARARIDDPADEARARAVESLMRMQLLQLRQARALAGQVLADPAAGTPSTDMARSVLAFLAAAGGDPAASTDLLAPVAADTGGWRRENPTLQFVLPMALGTRVAVALDLAGIDGILTDEFADLVQAGGFGVGSAWVSLLQAQAAWLRGRTDTAMAACEQACAALTANRLYEGNVHAYRAHVAALRGESDTAREALAAADRAPGSCNGPDYPWLTRCRAWVAAATGDLIGAVRLLQDVVQRLRVDGFAGHELLALHDLVRLGRPELAADRMAALLESVPGGPVAPLLLRHARAAADSSAEGLLAIARDFQGRGYLTFAAEAAATSVRLFRAARDPQALAASTLLGDVLARCDVLRTPALRTVQPALTTRERQVAELAADGAKSREIADQLFLSPRTVENHLQRVYAKLGVNGRVELAPALRSLPQ